MFTFEELYQVMKYTMEVIAFLGIFIEFTPCKISPLKWLGKRLNKDVTEKVEEMDKRITKLENTNERTYLDNIRSNVLKFATTCRNGRKHTAEEFENIISMISQYEEYCDKNNVKNEVMAVQSHYIKKLYESLSLEGEFFKKKKDGDLL